MTTADYSIHCNTTLASSSFADTAAALLPWRRGQYVELRRRCTVPCWFRAATYLELDREDADDGRERLLAESRLRASFPDLVFGLLVLFPTPSFMLRWSRKSRSSSLLWLLRLVLPAAFAAERRWLPGRDAPFEEPAAVSTTKRTIMANPRRAARRLPIAERNVSTDPRSLYSSDSSRKDSQDRQQQGWLARG